MTENTKIRQTELACLYANVSYLLGYLDCDLCLILAARWHHSYGKGWDESAILDYGLAALLVG